MSSSSEETHDNDDQARTAPLINRHEQVTAKDNSTPSQESTEAGSKPSCGTTSQQPDGSIPNSRKRSLDELTVTDPPEDEQHSSQSAFHQCRSQQNSIQQPQALPLASHSQALQLLLSAVHSHEGLSRWNHSTEGAPVTTTQDANQHPLMPAQDRTGQPSLFSRSSLPNNGRQLVSSARSAQLKSQLAYKQDLGHADMMYAPTTFASRISAQLIWDIQRLEHPEMDADSVQAALKFADAVQISPAQHAKQPGFPSQHVTQHATLLHTLEVGTGRLDVLRVLTHRVHSSNLSERSYGHDSPGQLMEVIQDLLKDMEGSRQLLYHAEQTVLAYKQAALARVESLQVHTRAAQEYWMQSQRLREVAAKRRVVLQKMIMLSEDCPSREILELYEKLRETVVHAMEVSATRVRLSSNMQAAQARLLAQGVSGVTTAGMINGAVELAVNRPVLRLQTLLRIIHGIDSTRSSLLAELASALSHGSWQQQQQQQQQPLPSDSYKLAEAVGQVQAGIKGLLQQGWRAAGPGQQGLAPIQTALAGKPVASRTPTKAAKAGDAHSPHDRTRFLENKSGRQAPDEASPRSALPLHASKFNAGLLSRESKSGPELKTALEASAPDAAPFVQAPVQAQRGDEAREHIIIRPRATRPQSGFSQYESGRDPRAQHMAVKQARSVTPQPEPALPRPSVEQPQARAVSHVPCDPARAAPPATVGTAQSPEVLAAAQALLQSHLQQLEPTQVSPQLLGLIHALCTNRSTENPPQSSPQASAHDHASNSPLLHAKPQTVKPAREDWKHHDKGTKTLVSGGRCQSGQALRLSRSDSGRGFKEDSSPCEGGSASQQGTHLNHMNFMNTHANSSKVYNTAVGEQETQAAAAYAQHLFDLLAAQAQAVKGGPGVQAGSTEPKTANKQAPKHGFAQQ